MTLSDRIQLIEDMIKEDKDCTIRDYLEALEEIAQIEKSEAVCHLENTPRTITEKSKNSGTAA